jgi:hypothetical protein
MDTSALVAVQMETNRQIQSVMQTITFLCTKVTSLEQDIREVRSLTQPRSHLPLAEDLPSALGTAIDVELNAIIDEMDTGADGPEPRNLKQGATEDPKADNPSERKAPKKLRTVKPNA